MRRANVTRIDTDLCCALQVGPLRALTVHQLRPAGCAGQASLFLCINQVSTRSLTHREPFDFRSVPTTTTDIDTRTCVYVTGFDSPTCRKLVRSTLTFNVKRFLLCNEFDKGHFLSTHFPTIVRYQASCIV